MKRLPLLLCLLPAWACAAPWSFGTPVLVAGASDSTHFHHLDGSGRQHVAASASEVALVWEDDRTGSPQIYLAVAPREAASFAPDVRLSDGEEAYEPALAALDGNRWLAAWEQDGAVVARVIDAQGLGPIQALAGKSSRQVTLVSDRAGRVAALWTREHDGGQLLEAAELKADGRAVALAGAAVTVAPVVEHPYQGYPAGAWGRQGRLLVAWEDRRAGHTRLFHTWRDPGQGFAAERQLNEHNAPHGEVPAGVVGLGSGVMRVVLAADGAGNVRAAWLDKRNPASGYAVWGALSQDGGRSFGPNQMVQDELGAAVPQWHAALAGGVPGFVAAWDDTREGWGDGSEPGDVVLSWNFGSAWSPDLVVPGASGEGYQGSPAVALDPQGDLHLLWIEGDDLSSPTRLRYLHGAFDPD
ncbi:MAG: hypothetical protein LJE59_10775 [Chromatiaceae bacterium]|nr:hypothetical protein [Chromatiaceae bacterium]